MTRREKVVRRQLGLFATAAMDDDPRAPESIAGELVNALAELLLEAGGVTGGGRDESENHD